METIHIELINNTAGYAGSALYRGSVDYCYVPNAPVDWTGQKIFEKVFKIKHFPEDQSYTSSDPLHVCFVRMAHLIVISILLKRINSQAKCSR